MKLFYQLTVIICLLTLVGFAAYIACEVHRLTSMVDGIRGEIPLGH